MSEVWNDAANPDDLIDVQVPSRDRVLLTEVLSQATQLGIPIYDIRLPDNGTFLYTTTTTSAQALMTMLSHRGYEPSLSAYVETD